MNILNIFSQLTSLLETEDAPCLHIVEPTGETVQIERIDPETGRIHLKGDGGASHEATAIARMVRDNASRAPEYRTLILNMADDIEAGEHLE